MFSKKVHLFILAFGLVLFTLPAVLAQEPEATDEGLSALDFSTASNVEVVGQGGAAQTQNVFVKGNLAYVDQGGRLTILNISTPSTPTLAGQTGVIPDQIVDIYVAGSYAYVSGRSKLWIINVSNPAAPAQAGSHPMPEDYFPGNTVVVGNYAYISNGTVLDVSDPARPTEVSHITEYGAYVAVSNNHAYYYHIDAHAERSDISIYDVSNPLVPQYLTKIENTFDDHAVAGNYLYTFHGIRGLAIYDISNPANPVLVSETEAVGGSSIKIEGNLALIRDDPDEGPILRVVNISNRANPVEAGRLPIPSPSPRGWDFDVAGNFVYWADGSLQIINISNPAQPTIAGAYNTKTPDFQTIRGQAVANGYAYLGGARLSILDVSDPTALTKVGTFSPAGHIQTVAVSGDYAYLALRNHTGDGWLVVVDVSNPAAPSRVGAFNPIYANDIHIEGDRLYAAADNGVYILDISNPANPRQIRFKATVTVHKVTALDVAGEYIYVTIEPVARDGSPAPFYADRGLNILDRETLQTVGRYQIFPSSEMNVIVNGPYAYLAHAYDINILDVSDPRQPVELSNYCVEGGIYDMAAADSYLYLAVSQSPGLQIVDISNPILPRPAGYYNAPGGGGRGLDLYNGNVYLVDDADTLLSLRFTPVTGSAIAPHGVEWFFHSPGARINTLSEVGVAVPYSTTLPLTTTWQTEEEIVHGQLELNQCGTFAPTIDAEADLMWSTPGTKAITLTVRNAFGQETLTRETSVWNYPPLNVSPSTGATLYESELIGRYEADPERPLLIIPAGAVDAPTTIQYTPLFTLPHPFTPTTVSQTTRADELRFADHVLTVEASQNGQPTPTLSLAQPAEIVAYYYYKVSDFDRLDEDALHLRRWNGAAWSSDGIDVERTDEPGFDGSFTRKFVFRTTNLGDFALFGTPLELTPTFLPLITKPE